MFENESPRPKAAEELLTERVDQAGWQHTLGKEKSYFVRGVTWVRNEFLPSASMIEDYVQALPNHLHEYQDVLGSTDFRWNERFSPRQALDAISLTKRKPLKFDKAVLTILCCDLVARDILKGERKPSTVFGRMYIEPSLFYIRDFDKEALTHITKQKPNILELLRDETNQTSRKVFEEMAEGLTVTKDLAAKALEIIKREVPDASVGEVDWRPREVRKGPALSQIIV